MDKQKIKLILIYSAVLGAILGALSIIPYINILAVIIMSVVSSVLVVIYMERRNEIGDLTIKGGGILGALIGFVSLVAFLVVCLPLNALLGLIFSRVTDYFALSRYLLSLWWLWMFMGGLITALFNSFALIAYVYIKDTFFMIEGKKDIKGNFLPKDRNNGF